MARAKTKEVKALTSSISKGQQSVTLLELLELNTHKLRLSIKSDAYKFQSHAKIERWDGTQWQIVWSIPHGAMSTEEGLVYQPSHRPVTRSQFSIDARTLIEQAKLILE